MQTAKLTGIQLDYWVAKAIGAEAVIVGNQNDSIVLVNGTPFAPSSKWIDGGPIIEKNLISLSYNPIDALGVLGTWEAYFRASDETLFEGGTPLEAAMRCRVAMLFGNEVAEKVTQKVTQIGK
jgi:hypothetical protein